MLSIIVPVLNEARRLPELLTQLHKLRLVGWEVIVVDGGSEDQSMALCSGTVDRLISAPAGRAAQMNAGARQASGSTLLFLHADTRLPNDVIDQLKAFEQSGAQWGFFPVRLRGDAWYYRMIEWCMNKRSALTSIATGDQVQCVRTRMFAKEQGFKSLALMEDIDLSKRLKRRGEPYLFASPVSCSVRKWQNHGVVRTIVLMWRLRLAFFLGADSEKLRASYYGD
ncbi:MAG: TIGR04283 family arsenosugar biosynthesis glycosyltransferase [Pseudomonadota bacterium]